MCPTKKPLHQTTCMSLFIEQRHSYVDRRLHYLFGKHFLEIFFILTPKLTTNLPMAGTKTFRSLEAAPSKSSRLLDR